jgi:hypothetical protein
MLFVNRYSAPADSKKELVESLILYFYPQWDVKKVFIPFKPLTNN